MFRHYYPIAFAPAQKLYQIGFLFTHKNGDFGAISVIKGSCATPISKVGRHISDKFCALLSCCVKTHLTLAEVNKLGRRLEPTKSRKEIFRSENWNSMHQTISDNCTCTMFDVCGRIVPSRAVAVHSLNV